MVKLILYQQHHLKLIITNQVKILIMVEYITFNEEKLPVRVSYYALSEYKNETGEEFSEDGMGSSTNLKMFEPIFFYSLVSGHRATGKEMKVKRDEMFEILEECFMEFANILPKFFPSSNEKKKSAPAVGNRLQKRAAEKSKK